MSYKTMVVNLAVDANPVAIVNLATELAQRFDGHLIGLAAADVPPLVATGEGLVQCDPAPRDRETSRRTARDIREACPALGQQRMETTHMRPDARSCGQCRVAWKDSREARRALSDPLPTY
ncbi:hypothetical protein [Mesorhizobium sp.]|uniref:hypothetical protein n=1 Tax=Mesorhizobium sp. TaxID=1871066 RepID=UPI0025BAD8A3|nr:hypothetical protein [Mesorhizobium sp.]